MCFLIGGGEGGVWGREGGTPIGCSWLADAACLPAWCMRWLAPGVAGNASLLAGFGGSSRAAASAADVRWCGLIQAFEGVWGPSRVSAAALCSDLLEGRQGV